MGTTARTGSFAEKFEEVIERRREREPGYGLRTLARTLAKDDSTRVETIRRRLNKYRPRPGGGAAETAPTEPTRHEIEAALGLERDALKPEPVGEDIAAMVSVLMPSATFRALIREELQRVSA